MSVSQNAQLMEQWRSTLKNEIVKSPCVPVSISDETPITRIMRSLKIHATVHPEKPAVIEANDNDRFLTYQQVHDRALSFAAFLSSRNFAIGDQVTIALPNSIEWPVLHLGTWAAGGVVVGSSTAFKLYETVYQLNDSGSSVVITSEPLLAIFLEAAKQCPAVKMIICIRSSTKPLPDGIIDFADTLLHDPIDEIAPVTLDDLCKIYYTSGTSGQPKGVLHTHRTIHYTIEIGRSHWEHDVYPMLGVKDVDWYKETQIISSGCFHIAAFNALNWCLVTGSTAVLMKAFDGNVFLDVIEKFKPKFLFVAPPVISYFVKEVKERKSALASVQLFLCGAAPLSRELSDEFRSCFPGVNYVMQAYGTTELGWAHVPLLLEEGVNASCGVMAAPYEQKIIDPITLQPCKQGQSGEVCLRGPPQTIGYLNKPEATRELIDEQGWIHTGDVGYIDERGLLYIVDRLKELIKVTYMNQALQVPPAELEGILISSKKVRDAAVIGIPDATVERGELVRAFVVKADETLTEKEVEDLVAEKLADFKRITGGVVFVDAIPRSPAGKILRRLLREIIGA